MNNTASKAELLELAGAWNKEWQKALDLWSPYTRLKNPLFCLSQEEEQQAGLSGSFAMIKLTDLQVLISIKQVADQHLGSYALEILAHEIGHHVYCPANLTDHARMLVRVKRALPRKEEHTGLICNLYSDLLINDRLYRLHNLRMAEIYRILYEESLDALWNFYMRIYEILMSLPKGTLTFITITDEMEADAILANRIIRHFAADWLRGAGRFAALCYTYLVQDEVSIKKNRLQTWLDTQAPGDGASLPEGLTEIEEGELTDCIHPSLDEELNGTDEKEEQNRVNTSELNPQRVPASQTSRSYREPFEYGQILRQLGIKLTEQEMAIKYYKELALPYLIPFPKVIQPNTEEPQQEGVTTWELGSPLENINWLESAIRNPVIIPGYTTYEQVWGIMQGAEPKKEPVNLDIYVDSSGSMPNPSANLSYLTLAGAIICLSALRAGSSVQATLWSGTREFYTTDGFIREEKKIMEILTGFFGGSTAFPIHILRDTFQNRSPKARAVHILVISDEGVTTMFDQDEKGNSGKIIAENSLNAAQGGGTFVLNLYGKWEDDASLKKAVEMGWDIYAIKDWKDLLEFSRDFTRKHYIEKGHEKGR